MYTTPRKVKQESRLRRSLSLISRLSPNNIGDAESESPSSQVSGTGTTTELIFCKETNPSSSSFFLHHFNTPVETNLPSTNNNSHKNNTAISTLSASSPSATLDPTSLNHFEHHPPPYREPPGAGGIYSSSNSLAEQQLQQQQIKDWNSFRNKNSTVISSESGQESTSSTGIHSRSSSTSEIFQTHSSKFPIVKEVILSKATSEGLGLSRSAQNLSKIPVPSPGAKVNVSRNHIDHKLGPNCGQKVQDPGKSQLPYIGWPIKEDNRKAYTLDSRTTKKFQDKLSQQQGEPLQRAKRRNSLDLEKFIQVFNEEQILMASMQGLHHPTGSVPSGIDNPALDLGGSHNNISTMYNGTGSVGKASSYYSSDSTNSTLSSSQSQSLSSSNTDSLDTVIFKGPSSNSGSIRDWQQQQQLQRASTESNMGEQHPSEFNHSRSNSRSEINSYRDTANNNNLFDGQSYQISSSQASPYHHQPMSHYNSPNNYSMEYRSAQQQQQQIHHQHQPHSQQPIIQSSHGLVNNNSSCSSNGHTNVLRNNGVAPSASYHHQLQQQQQQLLLGSNPQLPTKSPLLAQKQFSSSDGLVLDKAKESNSKHFSTATTKTYNHIKDMISSRFGNTMMNNKSNPINSSVLNNNSGSVNPYNNSNGLPHSSNTTYNSNNVGLDMTDIGLPTAAYGIQHHHMQQQQQQNGQHPYYASPQSISPYSASGSAPSINPSPNAYIKSPSMNNDRKNINTSFRKAIQKSTQKSNLVEDSLQMRTIQESSANNNGMPALQQQQFISASEHLQYQHQQQHQQTIAEQRAQRALDKLLCDGGGGLPNGIAQQQYARPANLSHPHGIPAKQQQAVLEHKHAPPPYPEKLLPQHHPLQQHSILRNSGHNSYATKPPSGSPSSADLAQYSKPVPLQRPNDEPPPLPTTQTPSLQPSPAIRENGDGSSNGTSNSLIEQKHSPNTANNIKSEQLKQITTDLQNLALSVVVGMNGGGETQSSGSEGDMKGSQRVGSGQSHDSGVGTINSCKASPPPIMGAESEPLMLDGLIGLRSKFGNAAGSNSSGNDSEWVDIVEPEIRQIIEMQHRGKPNAGNSTGKTQPQGSALSNNLANNTLQHNSQKHIASQSPKLPKHFDLNTYNKKSSHEPGPSSCHVPTTTMPLGNTTSAKTKSPSKIQPASTSANLLRSNSGSGQNSNPTNNSNTWNSTRTRPDKTTTKASTMNRNSVSNNNKDLLLSTSKSGKLTRSAMNQILYSLNDDNGDITSTTTGGLDLESMLDGPTENTSDDDDDLSTTIDTTDAHAIRRQLESLETMYTEVLKVLGAKKFGGAMGSRYPPPTDLRTLRRRPYGSMSSLPSSVSSRPFKESKRRIDEKKKVKDIKSINRRFQRLESHVVTLARSVAHLSSEMRTQHLMVQEMESIRNELSQLRSQIMKIPLQTQAPVPAPNTTAQTVPQNQRTLGRNGGANLVNSTDWTSFRNALPSLTNPCRVRKLTKFFGDEPPLIRIFLKKLGYEKYAIHFEQERIGIMELPYLTEERLQKMGIPMGPRLRILQEAHMCLKPGAHFTVEHQLHNGNTGNLSVYVV